MRLTEEAPCATPRPRETELRRVPERATGGWRQSQEGAYKGQADFDL